MSNPKPYTDEEIEHMRSSTRGEYERERLTVAECYNNERAWLATLDAERSRAEKAESSAVEGWAAEEMQRARAEKAEAERDEARRQLYEGPQMTPDERAWWSTFCTQRLSDMGERRAFLSCIRAAVAEEREACAKIVETAPCWKGDGHDLYVAARLVRARGVGDE